MVAGPGTPDGHDVIPGTMYAWAVERLADRTPGMHAAWLRRRWEIQRDRWPAMTATKTAYRRRRNRQ